MGSTNFILKKMLWIFVSYIVLHSAAGAINIGYKRDLLDAPESSNYSKLSKQQRYDRILSGLHDLFKQKSKVNSVYSRNSDYNDFNVISPNKDYDKQEFDEGLDDVTTALDKIKADLKQFNNDGLLTMDVADLNHENRYKREVGNETIAYVPTLGTITEVNLTDNETTTEKVQAATEQPQTITEKNVTVPVKTELLRANNDTDSNASSRRMMPDYISTTSRVKDKLLSYLEDTFNEVERKIRPLTNIKIALSNDDNYRIGYIIATIDTLEVNLKKLKNDMNLHQHIWDDRKILDLFDRIKATNTVTSSLLDSLKKYLPKQ